MKEISEAIASLQVGLYLIPWESDRVQRWLRKAEERYLATTPDPLFLPPWQRWQDMPDEAIEALANTLLLRASHPQTLQETGQGLPQASDRG